MANSGNVQIINTQIIMGRGGGLRTVDKHLLAVIIRACARSIQLMV